VSMRSKLSLKNLLDPNLNFSVEEIHCRYLTEVPALDEIFLAAPIEIHRFRHLLERGIDKALPGAIIIMVPDDLNEKDSELVSLSGSNLDPVFVAEHLKKAEVACVFVSENAPISDKWSAACQNAGLPLIGVEMSDKILTDKLLELFHLLTAPTQTVHGNMMDLFGVGILILGRSGIGKSECCLDLIMKGHRLVADDSTLLYKNRQGGVTATVSRKFAGGWMEIRGVGIIDVDLLYGIAALRKKKDLHAVVELMDWPEWKAEMKKQGNGRLSGQDLGRFLAREPGNSGNIEERNLIKSYLGIEIPLIQIPVGPGRSIANLIEVAARKQMMEFSTSRVRTKFPSGN
jgi:serine kinase of HPr protein (carbohydrate metabolism regulator)